MTVFRLTLKRSFSNKTNLILLTLFPIACILFPKGQYWPVLPYGYQYFGIVMLFISIRLTSIILEDRVKGVVKRLAVAPIRYGSYLCQNLLAYSVILVIQCAIVVYGGVLLGIELYQPNWLMLLYVSYSFTSLAAALAWISIFRSKEAAFLIYMSLVSLVSILGGLLMPLYMFPEALKRLAVLFPTYWLDRGINWVAAEEPVVEFLLINGVLWLYTIIFLILGSTRKIH